MEKETVVEVVETEVVEEVVEQEESLADRIKRLEDEVIKTHETTIDINKEIVEFNKKQEKFFKDKVKFELQKNGLQNFEEVINPLNDNELNETIAKLTKIVNDIKIANSYQPKDNATQDAYSVAQKQGDTKKMIGSKLANLFK